MQHLALLSSATSSSFQLLQQNHRSFGFFLSWWFRAEHAQLWKDLFRLMSISDPQVSKEPTKASLGSNLKELESAGVHEEPTQHLNVAAIINSDHSHNLPSTTSPTNNSTITVTPPNPSVTAEISVQEVSPTRANVSSMESDTYIINTPTNPSTSPPHEDNKLGFTVFAVELVASLTNLLVSSETNHNQLLIYVVMACSTLAFYISSTALT